MDHQKKELYAAKRDSGANVDEQSLNVYRLIRDGENNNTWILLSYVNNSMGQFREAGVGLDAMINSLTDDEVFFGVVKLNVSAQMKYFHIFFMGSNVGGMKRGKASLHKAGILQKFEGCHGEVYFEGKENITTVKIIEQISKLINVKSTDISEY